MAALPPPKSTAPVARILTIALACVLFAACHRSERDELLRQTTELKAEAEAAQGRLTELEKRFATHRDELALTQTTLESTKSALAEKEAALADRDGQWRTAQAELEKLRKSDALVFAAIRAQQQQGRNIIALADYQKFLRDHPGSAFAPDATAAIAALTAQTQTDNQRWAEMTDPKRKERELLELFRDGLLTPRELAPLIKRKSRAQVLALLGKPSHVFPDGTEIGYNDKITNPATGRRSMLVITFDAGIVAAVRADYAGQKLIP